MESDPEGSTLRELLTQISTPLLLVEGERIKTVSQGAQELLKSSKSELTGRLLESVITPLEETDSGLSVKGRNYRAKTKNDDELTLLVEEGVSPSPGDTAKRLLVLHDLSYRIELEKELNRYKSWISAIMNSIPFGLWVNDDQGRNMMQSRVSRELWGDTQGLELEEAHSKRDHINIWREANNKAYQGDIVRQQIGYNIGGKTRYFDNIVGPVRNSHGAIRGILGMNIEVTEHHNMVQERERLINEIHHRVKNNLQMIISMINLQIDSHNDPAVLEEFQEIKSRILSLSILHEHLYQNQRFGLIEVNSYINDLVGHLKINCKAPKIPVKIEVEELLLPLTTATPLALITTELFTNACKYGYLPEGSNKPIEITLHRINTGEKEKRTLLLQVRDYGPGLPPEFSESNSHPTGLGIELIRSLSEQIGGTAQWESKNGTTCSVLFAID
ncbi:MAG: ATP-binding protein [Spirochaetales bacterium]|nr:ATP-binding protein [Spirochaetales bacterium]MCF7938409.1 ATP-binding protein [Spirochaetales bacterium]